jgi:hypothetical protein
LEAMFFCEAFFPDAAERPHCLDNQDPTVTGRIVPKRTKALIDRD